MRSKTTQIQTTTVLTDVSDDFSHNEQFESTLLSAVMTAQRQLDLTFGFTNDPFLADNTECVLAEGGWLYLHLQWVYQFLPDIQTDDTPGNQRV